MAIVSAGQTIYQESAHAQFTGQTQASQCDTSSFMVGDVNAAIDARFSDIPFISGPLCSLMDKAVLVTVLIGFVILIVAGFDSQRNEKKFMTALSHHFSGLFLRSSLPGSGSACIPLIPKAAMLHLLESREASPKMESFDTEQDRHNEILRFGRVNTCVGSLQLRDFSPQQAFGAAILLITATLLCFFFGVSLINAGIFFAIAFVIFLIWGGSDYTEELEKWYKPQSYYSEGVAANEDRTIPPPAYKGEGCGSFRATLLSRQYNIWVEKLTNMVASKLFEFMEGPVLSKITTTSQGTNLKNSFSSV